MHAAAGGVGHLAVQFARFVGNAVQGEFGLSLRQGRKVSALIAEVEGDGVIPPAPAEVEKRLRERLGTTIVDRGSPASRIVPSKSCCRMCAAVCSKAPKWPCRSPC